MKTYQEFLAEFKAKFGDEQPPVLSKAEYNALMGISEGDSMSKIATVEAVEVVELLWAKFDDLDAVIAILKDAEKYATFLASSKPLHKEGGGDG